jgi:N-acetylglucosaminyldiphosphoundecaprenol N-acetyl-beta-D-mannosaminyltransferase
LQNVVPERVSVLGVGVDAVQMADARNIIARWIRERDPRYVTVIPAHAIMDARRDPELRRMIYESGLATPDGMAVVWVLRLCGYRNVERVYGPDLMLEVCRDGLEKGYRHFLFGGESGVADALRRRLEERFPGLEVVGTWSPPFRPISEQEDRVAVELINAARPDIVWVGLGTPKQERWMAAHLGRLTAPVMIGVGAAFDFLSGRKPQAPRWIQRIGMEWFFRLATEPRRLWPRYRQYPWFVLLALAQLTGLRRFPAD